MDIPSKVLLDAETDQAFALIRDKRPSQASLTVGLAEGVADQIRSQFGPGQGRIVMALAQSLGCVEKVMREDYGTPMRPGHLFIVAALAAEQLDRED